MSTVNVEVHDTAFVISCFRASDEVLSGDPYSKFLITEKAQEWVRTYTEEVCPNEPFVHCLRNRFFLDQISSFFQENENGVLINIGSGFSWRPFFADRPLFLETSLLELRVSWSNGCTAIALTVAQN